MAAFKAANHRSYLCKNDFMTSRPDYAALFAASPYPYLLIDKDFFIIGANPAYLRATGRNAKDLIGKPIFEAFPANPSDPDSIIGLAFLGGCGKTEQNSTIASQTTESAARSTAQPESRVVRNLGYYQAHLDEAKKTWDECQKMSPEAITEPVRMDCSMAQTAWSTQPYKATPSTFSSNGGRH